ncbi:hypothetical protein GCM10010430_51870 [Kitasatospora cystarginea]|uniref:Uncharacterized protein n=1 Tax=Kitasatospora cystarginea TaxID=58350 RepID=A0ABP5RGM9_9ACTN
MLCWVTPQARRLGGGHAALTGEGQQHGVLRHGQPGPDRLEAAVRRLREGAIHGKSVLSVAG